MQNITLSEASDFLLSEEWVQALLKRGASIYLVGGFVRDAILKKESKDMDFVIENVSIDKIKNLLFKFGVVREDNVGETFKVLKFKPTGWQGEEIDIATPRKDIKVGTGHKGFKTIGVTSIKEDLKRRDFTINSIAFEIEERVLLDPFNGLGDLEKGIIKATDKKAFVHDPLRILRAIQFASRFEFDIEKGTKNLMKKNALLIKEITGERMLGEFKKILDKKGDTELALNLIAETNLDEALFSNKLIDYDEMVHNHLDPLSFFYLLGMNGGVHPEEFYRETLKGDKQMGKDLRILKNLLYNWDSNISEEMKKFRLFKAIEIAPSILKITIAPEDMDDLFFQMRSKKIPTFKEDIQINGNDVKEKIGECPKVGLILADIQRAALMNEFNWKDRQASLKFLNTKI